MEKFVDEHMDVIRYSGQNRNVAWMGVSLDDGDEFRGFLTNRVASRVNDQDLQSELTEHLKGLVSTGFEADNLANILDQELPEERDWAIGEAVAEVWLSENHGLIWPWNNERDKKTPLASLPGADLVGFIEEDGKHYLALGEVKSSRDKNTPPQVLYGKSGMINQLESLSTSKSLLFQLIKWLWPRCCNTDFSGQFDSAITTLLQSDCANLRLFGVLIRDTKPEKMDLQGRAATLAGTVSAPMECRLAALYLPCQIAQLPDLIADSGEGT